MEGQQLQEQDREVIQSRRELARLRDEVQRLKGALAQEQQRSTRLLKRVGTVTAALNHEHATGTEDAESESEDAEDEDVAVVCEPSPDSGWEHHSAAGPSQPAQASQHESAVLQEALDQSKAEVRALREELQALEEAMVPPPQWDAAETAMHRREQMAVYEEEIQGITSDELRRVRGEDFPDCNQCDPPEPQPAERRRAPLALEVIDADAEAKDLRQMSQNSERLRHYAWMRSHAWQLVSGVLAVLLIGAVGALMYTWTALSQADAADLAALQVLANAVADKLPPLAPQPVSAAVAQAENAADRAALVRRIYAALPPELPESQQQRPPTAEVAKRVLDAEAAEDLATLALLADAAVWSTSYDGKEAEARACTRAGHATKREELVSCIYVVLEAEQPQAFAGPTDDAGSKRSWPLSEIARTVLKKRGLLKQDDTYEINKEKTKRKTIADEAAAEATTRQAHKSNKGAVDDPRL